MKTKLILTLTALLALADVARAQGTAFIYQGRLTVAGAPANGLYDFVVSVADAPVGGSILNGAIFVTNRSVTNGLFTVTLNPGPGVFTGAPRWLDILVRTNGATSYAPLEPRQPILSTPYAIHAASAGSATSVPAGTVTGAMLADGAVTSAKLAPGAVNQLSAPDGSPNNALLVDTNGLVGVGTSSPDAGLHIATSRSFSTPQQLSSVMDGVGGYTNLQFAQSVAVEGTLTAVSGADGVTLLDLANPASPVRRSQFRDGDGVFTNLSGPYDLALRSHLLAVAAYNDHAVTLISVTNPANPVRLAVLRDGVGGWNELGNARGVSISGTLMAIAAYADNAVTLASIVNPAAPSKRVEMKDGLFGFTNLAGAFSVALSGNLLAIAAVIDDTVTLVDVTDPANPIKRAELRDGVDGYGSLNGVRDVALSGNLLAIAAELDHAVTLVDISNPASPVKLAEWKDGINADSLQSVQAVAFSGNLLAASGRSDNAVTFFDVTSPSDPSVLSVARQGAGGFTTLKSASGLAFVGANLVVAAQDSSAVTVLDLAQAVAGLVVDERVGIGTTQPAGALHVVGNLIVEAAQSVMIRAGRVALGTTSTATGNDSTALGAGTSASGEASTAMGRNSSASGLASTAVGDTTTASGSYSTAMGLGTTASGFASTAMGRDTSAGGNYSMAMGRRAKASHQGAFVWTDAQDTDVVSTAANQFLIRASGGVGIGITNPAAQLAVSSGGGVPAPQVHLDQSNPADYARLRFTVNGDYSKRWDVGCRSNVFTIYSGQNSSEALRLENNNAYVNGALILTSDRNAKENLRPVDPRTVLEKVATLPMQEWNYRADQERTRHLGPMAQDFHAAFRLGTDDKHIATVDADGVALAAIQGLNQKLEDSQRENAALKQRVENLENLLRKLVRD